VLSIKTRQRSDAIAQAPVDIAARWQTRTGRSPETI
jgi:hypothetical protein